ncbi:MAG: hypothetical protein WC785_00445 [Tatlockia sp.]|jgi:hypothetical protein
MTDRDSLKGWIQDMAVLIEQNAEPDPHHYTPFLKEPELSLRLVELIEDLEDDEEKEGQFYYSACVFALDICVAQLQSAEENGSKQAGKILNQLMSLLAKAIRSGKQSLSFWLPVLNAFYEVHVELSSELKEAYLDLAGQEEELSVEEEGDHLNTMRDMLSELSDLSDFDVAENFFAQSYAMPADFFTDLIFDLYSIEEGNDIALLALLHPKQDVREVVLATLEQLMDNITLSSIALSRLQTIKDWYPASYHAQFNRWIKLQRKKGVIFSKAKPLKIVSIKASEIDGGGAQGIFIHLKKGKKHRLSGLLFKENFGVKDAWITPEVNADEIDKYYVEAFDDSITLREVDASYLGMLTNHFLEVSIRCRGIPHLHLLELQEAIGLHFNPIPLDIPYLMDFLSIQIAPFTAEEMELSFKRSKKWAKNKRFAESWYIESAEVDKLVNRRCTIVDGIKICALEEAMDDVFERPFETHRDKWLFHFLWTALWARAKAHKNEKIWQDSFFVAYTIYQGKPLKSIPIMQEICNQTVLNSIETMQERRTYLNKE